MLNLKYKLIIEHVAHDLNSVVIKINLLNEILHDKMKDNKDAEIKKVLSYIDTLCGQGIEITKDLLDMRELETSENNETERCSLNQLLEQQTKIYRLQSLKKQVRFQFIDSGQQIFCNINRSKITRAIDNLFSNALKFTTSKGEIKISIDCRGKKAIVAITDTGIGIPDNLKREIFKKYTKASRYGTQNEIFTGLGLYITKKVVELHNGRIWFESEENIGTTFFIELRQVK